MILKLLEFNLLIVKFKYNSNNIITTTVNNQKVNTF